MDGSLIPILLNIVVLLALLIPAVRGFVSGFVKTALHALRFLIAFALSFAFAKPLGFFIKERWLGARFYDIVWESLAESWDAATGSAGMTDALPGAVRAILQTFGFDVGAAANEAAAEGEAMLQSFALTVSDRIANIVSVVLAFGVIFILSLLLLSVVAKLLTFLIEKIPLIGGMNRILGLGAGLLVGVFVAWTVAQLLVSLLTAFTSVDYTGASVLNFFHDISPLRWILQLIAESMAGVVS